MENKIDNKLSVELSLKFQMKDYRLRFSSTKGWVLAAVIILIKLGLIMIREGP